MYFKMERLLASKNVLIFNISLLMMLYLSLIIFYSDLNSINPPSKKDRILAKHLKDQVYLDYTGSGVYFDDAITEFSMKMKDIFDYNRDDVYREVRREILDFVDADYDEYDVLFCMSTTQALKTIGEFFPWQNDSVFSYTTNNHNSVLGVRKYTSKKNGRFQAIHQLSDIYRVETTNKNNLFIFPLQENFAGTKFDEKDIKDILEDEELRAKWYVVGDAAAYLPSNKLSMRKRSYDGIVLSFYKIIGFPNYGALILNRSFKNLLKSTIERVDEYDMRSLVDEPSLADMLAVQLGIRRINEFGIASITKLVSHLSDSLTEKLSGLRHSTNTNAVEIYNRSSSSTVTFNLLDHHGKYVGYNKVISSASKSGFHLRGGCHCNPGSCFNAMKLDESKVRNYFNKKTTCGDDYDVIDGVPLGAIRVSFGWASKESDVTRLVEWIKENYVL